MLTLLLVCSFSPRVHSIPRGPLNIAKAERQPAGVQLQGNACDSTQNPLCKLKRLTIS